MPDCDPHKAFILPANCLKKQILQHRSAHQSGDSGNEKSVTRNLINGLLCGIGGTLEKANKSIDGLRAKTNSKQHSNRNSFVLVPEASDSDKYRRSLTPDLNPNQKSSSTKSTDDSNCDTLQTATIATSTTARMNSSSKFPASISSPNLSKQDSSSSTGSSSRYGLGKDGNELMNRLFCESNEDYIKSIESYEERLAKGTQTSSSQSSSASGTMKRNTKKKNLVVPPAAAATVSSSSKIKPSTIFNLSDRDLIIIDKQDIKESTSHQSDVIIVDPPPQMLTPSPSEEEHLDLNDLLVGEWPESAGGAASMLNSDKRHPSASVYRQVERNKSINPISHFVSTTKPKKDVTFENFNGGDYKKSKLFHDVLHNTLNDKILHLVVIFSSFFNR